MKHPSNYGLFLAATFLVVGSAAAGAPLRESREAARRSPDIDGNGYSDLVVGVPGEVVGGTLAAGAVNVLYGTATGLSAAGDQIWDQGTAGIVGTPNAGDDFGLSLAIGDFNGDWYVDVAVGIPDDGVTSNRVGGVQVLYGSSSGFSAVGNQLWSQDSPFILDVAEDGDDFGVAVTAGDFDGDGYDDLAIGVPLEDLGAETDAGAVNILYGTAAGLSSDRNMFLHQDVVGTFNAAEAGDRFGRSLAAGDFDGDGYDDLAVGIEGEDNGSVVNSGAVHVFYGSGAGIDAVNDWYFQQSTSGMADSSEVADFFGYSLAAGDYDGDGYCDLAVGVPREDIDALDDAGAVHVVFGTTSGLAVPGNQFWHQGVTGMDNAAEGLDLFGYSLAAGDFDRDGFDDLAVGIPYEDNGAIVDSGAVHVIYGAGGGLGVAGNWFFHQNTPGMADDTEVNDSFGFSVAAGDFDRDGYADLAVGVYREDVDAVVDCGVVHVVSGSVSGLTTAGNQIWHQNSPGVEDECEFNEHFGFALATQPSAVLFNDGFETGDTTHWSSISP